MKKKLLSVLICFVMVLGIAPTTALASDATEITEIKTIMPVDTVPKAGMEVRTFMPSVPDGEPYERDRDGTEWYDSEGVKIAPTLNHHYDIGYEFEAGHTYYADYEYTADEGYVFVQNPTITFTGPDPSMFTYEIVDRWDNNRGITVRYIFTIPGEFDYPDINKVSMMYYGTPRDGGKQPDSCEVIYNNCTITREEWNTGTWGSNANWGIYEEDGSNAPTFLAGETYVHMIELTAKDGYQFSQSLYVQKGTQDAEEYGVVSLSADRTVATVKYTYEIPEIEIIDTIELVAANQHMYFCLRSGESIYLPQPFIAKYASSDDCPYKVDSVNACEWYDTETGENLLLGYPQTFENGRKYALEFNVRIKDEYATTHKFASGTDLGLNVTDYAYANSDFVEFEVSGGDNIVNVKVTFTTQFPEGAGSSANQPAYCYSYEEFKFAMENDDIRYVALGNVDDMLPSVPHDEEENPGSIETKAIVVRGNKDLNLTGNAVFKCPLTNNYDLKYYTELMTLTSAANSDLYIHGEGSLTYEAGNLYFFNSVIKVEGGSLCVDGATVRGSNGYHTGYCYGINALYGGVSIQGGATIIGEVYEGYGVCALSLGEEGLNESLSVSIWNGNFYVDRDVEDGNYDHGIWVKKDCGLRIYGATMDGIKLHRHAADNLSKYVQDGCVMTVNGVKVNPANYGTVEGSIVEVYKEITDVNIHVNSPVAGKNIPFYTEDVYLVPEGCSVKEITWYENGEGVSTSQFIAGNSYKAEIVLVADDGVRLKNPLDSATINYKNASVSAYAGNIETGIVLTVDFGECPDVVNAVELTVKAPKEGNTPSYIVDDESNAYSAVTDPVDNSYVRKWFESPDGESNWREMSRTDKYKAGYYYRLYVDVNTLNGNQFAVYDNGSSIVPDVSATVNGYYANVIKAYEQDPSEYITVKYDFGICNDSVIESVAVVDVKAPVAGENPQFVCNLLGTGYGIQNLDDTWYRINSITWKDEDSFNTYLGEDDVFVPGRRYRFTVYIEAEEGYEFATTKDGYARPQNTATVNGKAATAILPTSNATTKQEIVYIFTCEQEEIDTVILYDLDAPEGGKTPDRTITAAYPELYNVEELIWYDCEDNVVSGEETFRQGEQYKVQIKVVPTQSNGYDVCKFITPARAYIDSEEVSERLNWDEVYVSDGAMYIKYTFIKGASAPDIEIEEYTYYYFPGEAEGSADFDIVASGTEITLAECMFEAPEGKTFLGWAVGDINAELKQPGDKIIITGETYIYAIWNSYTISGTVKSFNDGDATIELFKDGEAVDFMDSNNSYSFSGLTEGTYTLKVSKSKHATREYEITVTGNTTQNVEIWLYGDVTKDGLVNNADTIQINRKNANLTSVFSQVTDSDYRIKVANVTAIAGVDSIINNADVIQINRKNANLNSVFSALA